MKTIHKEYERPFVLEVTKLTRLVGVLHDRLEDQHPSSLTDRYEIFLSGSRREEATSLDEVLAVENLARFPDSPSALLLRQSAQHILAHYSHTPYAPDAAASELQRLAGSGTPPGSTQRAHLEQLEKALTTFVSTYPESPALPSLYVSCIRAARREHDTVTAARWSERLTARFPKHPAALLAKEERSAAVREVAP